MKDLSKTTTEQTPVKFSELTAKEKQNFVAVFVLLRRSDKRNNPQLYQTNKPQNDRYSLPIDTTKQGVS